MSKKNMASILPAVLFIGLLGFMSGANLLLPQKDFSEMENRSLAKFPPISVDSIRSGQWMTDFEGYASDQFLLRDRFMELKTAADSALLKKDNGRVYFGRDDYLFSTDLIDEKQAGASLQVTGDFLSRVRQQYPQLKLSVLLAPTAKTVLADKLPAFAPVSDEEAAIAQAENILLKQVPGLIFTDPSSSLREAAAAPEAPPLYYRTDHHWTAYGAYTAYENWALDNGFAPAEPDQLKAAEVTSSFLGTHQAKAPGISLMPDTITRLDPSNQPAPDITVWKDITKTDQREKRNTFFDPAFLDTKDQYAYFLGGNDPQVHIRTGVKNGRRLLLIKDSYANCLVPLLALHYEEILITDLRYSHGKILWPHQSGGTVPPITDVLFLYNIETFCSDRNLAYLMQLSFPAGESQQ